MEQMGGRIPAYSGGLPIWFWFSPKPDLRHRAHLPRGEQAVRLELELPRETVLLSDFDTWHCVLNLGTNCPLSLRPSFNLRGITSAIWIW